MSVGLLFRRRLDAVLDSLERDLVEEPQVADQLPSAVDIVVSVVSAFRPERLVVNPQIARKFVIEDIMVGSTSQLVATPGIPAEIFSASSTPSMVLSTVMPGLDMRFRVRYVGDDPAGERFMAALIGTVVDTRSMTILPVDSGGPIVA